MGWGRELGSKGPSQQTYRADGDGSEVGMSGRGERLVLPLHFLREAPLLRVNGRAETSPRAHRGSS